LERETALGVDHEERLTAIAVARSDLDAELTRLTARWEQERGLVERIRDIRGQIEAAHVSASAADTKPTNGEALTELRAQLTQLNTELDQVQGDKPLMRVAVDGSIVGEVISGWTGIPVGKMLRDQLSMMLELERHLEARIIGQDHAMESISR